MKTMFIGTLTKQDHEKGCVGLTDQSVFERVADAEKSSEQSASNVNASMRKAALADQEAEIFNSDLAMNTASAQAAVKADKGNAAVSFVLQRHKALGP